MIAFLLGYYCCCKNVIEDSLLYIHGAYGIDFVVVVAW